MCSCFSRGAAIVDRGHSGGCVRRPAGLHPDLPGTEDSTGPSRPLDGARNLKAAPWKLYKPTLRCRRAWRKGPRAIAGPLRLMRSALPAPSRSSRTAFLGRLGCVLGKGTVQNAAITSRCLVTPPGGLLRLWRPVGTFSRADCDAPPGPRFQSRNLLSGVPNFGAQIVMSR